MTGASDGIGEEFCRELGRRGYNLILVARREGKLREVANELVDAHGIDARVVPCDLAAPRAAHSLYNDVRALCAEVGADVDVLVNNAGLLYNGYFDEIALAKQEDLLAVNVVALTALTHLIANDMLARGRGRILNVASTAAWVALPQQNVYSASKAYVLSFTLALANELKSKNRGVTATALCPGYTATKMLDNPEQGPKLSIPSAMVLPPDVVAREGITACLRGAPIVTPGLSNRIGMGLVQLAPRRWATAALGWAYRRGQS
ncbi:MAG: SDR family oxidoreductase [Mycobacterium sp.]|nr:SDR family oxidoreductase [Mycobacterium sp.]